MRIGLEMQCSILESNGVNSSLRIPLTDLSSVLHAPHRRPRDRESISHVTRIAQSVPVKHSLRAAQTGSPVAHADIIIRCIDPFNARRLTNDAPSRQFYKRLKNVLSRTGGENYNSGVSRFFFWGGVPLFLLSCQPHTFFYLL